MLVLGFDTALLSCSAAVLRDGKVLARAMEPLEKGHAERIAPMADAVLREAGVAVRELDRAGVVVGPGGFAGVRVGLAFARGLALGTRMKVVGVSSLEALAAAEEPMLRAAVVDARRGEAYAALFDEEMTAILSPFAAAPDEARARIIEAAKGRPLTLCGASALLAPYPENWTALPPRPIDPAVVARIAAAAPDPNAPPAPLYLRGPDVKPGVPSRFAALLAEKP